MKTKIFCLAIALSLLAASCSPFSQPVPAGLAKTTNGGSDWQFINKVKDNDKASLQSLNISKLAFSPKTRETVFAGSYSGGLYKSEDSGGAWANILSKILVYDFAVDPFDERIIYAAGFFDNHGKVLKTTDGGAAWVEIYNEASEENPVRSIAINPQNSSQLLIGMASGNIIKSMDGGMTWAMLKNFEDRVNRVLWQQGGIYVLLRGKGLQKSPDLSGIFQDLTSSLNNSLSIGNLNFAQQGVESFSQVAVDQALPSLIYVTTDKGLYKTADEGKAWTLQALPVKGDAHARGIAIARSSSNIVYTNVGATMYKSTDGGSSWRTQGIKSAGYINYILVDPQLPQIAYAGIYVVSD